MEWENIDLQRGVISIKQTLYRAKSDKGKKKTEIVIALPKSDTSVRDIPLPKFLTAKLKAIEHGGGFLINRKARFYRISKMIFVIIPTLRLFGLNTVI